MLGKLTIGRNQYENVTTIPVQNTLSTRVKQIRNPQKEISGGFFNTFYLFLYFSSNF